MAKFCVTGTEDQAVEMPLVATVEILSKFDWKTDVLERRLATAGGKCGAPRVMKRRRTKIFKVYSISWGFLLSYSGVVDGPEERLQQQAENILAVFVEMEEKVEVARNIEEPLSWLLPEPDEEPMEACCIGEPCCE